MDFFLTQDRIQYRTPIYVLLRSVAFLTIGLSLQQFVTVNE